MKRLTHPVEEATRPSRRKFLWAGGAMVATLSLGRARAVGPAQTSEEREKIREIMKRYGSELGYVRYDGRE